MNRRHLWISALLLLLIVARLVISWPDRSLWYDETVNAYFAKQSWNEIWEWNTQIDNQVPLHFVLLKLWGSIAGTSEFALRTFSFCCAILTAAGIIALGKRIGSTIWAGWLAALALALSQSFLYAAFEVRTYGLALALFVLSSVILWELWERHANRNAFTRGYYILLAVYLLLVLNMVYSHYTGFLALATHGVYIGSRTLRRPSRQRVMIPVHIVIGVMLGYLPWIVALAGRDVRAGTAYGGSIKPGVALETYLEFYAHGQRLVPDDTPDYALSIAVLVIAALLASLVYRRYRGLDFALFAAVVPLIGLITMVYAVQGKLSGRHGWPAWAGASLLIGLGLAALARFRWLRWPVWAAALLIMWLPASESLGPIYDSQLREAFAYIEEHAEPGDALILRDGTLFTAAGYYGNRLPRIGLPPEQLLDVNRFLFYDEALAHITELVSRTVARRVWVVSWQGHIMDPQDLAAGILEYIGDSQPIERPFGDVIVTLYTLHHLPEALEEKVESLEPVVKVPSDGPTYFGGYVLDKTVPHGGVVQMQTWWQRGDVVKRNMRVSVRLYGPDDIVYTQLDMPPVAWSFGQEHWQAGSPILSRFALWVPYEIPSGPVEIKMVIYDMKGAFDPITVPVDTFEISD